MSGQEGQGPRGRRSYLIIDCGVSRRSASLSGRGAAKSAERTSESDGMAARVRGEDALELDCARTTGPPSDMPRSSSEGVQRTVRDVADDVRIAEIRAVHGAGTVSRRSGGERAIPVRPRLTGPGSGSSCCSCPCVQESQSRFCAVDSRRSERPRERCQGQLGQTKRRKAPGNAPACDEDCKVQQRAKECERA